MNKARIIAAEGLFVAVGAWALLHCPEARAQLIDAGGQANLMHQQELLRNQTTGDGPDWAGDDTKQRTIDDELRKKREQHRTALQPEYARRLRIDGKASADAWLSRTTDALAKRDRELLRARYGQ